MAEAASTYRLGVAHLVRIAGTFVIGLGVLWVVATLLGVGGARPGGLALLTIGVLVGLALAFARPPRILSLDETGYRVRWVRGAGRTRATWREVENVTSRQVGGTALMVVELKDGTTTTVPLTLLGTKPAEGAARRA